MISNMITKMKYFHLKLIHEHPKGIKNRFQNTADKWVQSLNHSQVKTYYQFFQNFETKTHDVKLHLSDKEQSYLQQIQASVRPGLAGFAQWNRFNFATRPDDKQISRDVSGMTIGKFIKEGRQNLTDIHKLVLTAGMFIIVHTILYFLFYYGKQQTKIERLKVLNAEIIETYHFTLEEEIYKKINHRIKIVNEQYQKLLKQSKLY